MEVEINLNNEIENEETLAIYRANGWSSAELPRELIAALRNSHSLVTARVSGRLVGLGNAIADGHLVVYYPHLLVHPEYQGKGIGWRILNSLKAEYSSYHQQVLIADGKTINFYKSAGFERAGKTEAMWIYSGDDH